MTPLDFAKLSEELLNARVQPIVRARKECPENAETPSILLFSPHPDDEVITGSLPLRFQQELGFRVINIAVTLGSDLSRREARKEELEAACKSLGWGNHILGWTELAPGMMEDEPARAEKLTWELVDLIHKFKPIAVFYPHADDHHPTHIATSKLVSAALDQSASNTIRFETEFWRPMSNPNCLVECSNEQLADLITALMCHEGEVARNPYHLRLPSWMADNVRRGAELIGGKGAEAPKMPFGTLYKRLGSENSTYIASPLHALLDK